MKKSIMLIVFMLPILLNSQTQDQWENASKGLEGYNWLKFYNFESILYEKNFGIYSDDSAKTWKAMKFPFKYGDGEVMRNYYFRDLFNYRDLKIGIGPWSAITFDDNYWKSFEFMGLPEWGIKINKYFAFDSNFIIQLENINEVQLKYSTYISKTVVTPDSTAFHFTKSEIDIQPQDEVIEFSVINDTLFATTSSLYAPGKFYYSNDGGMNWVEDSIPGMDERIQYIKYIDGKYFYLTKTGIWYEDNSGIYKKCESEYLPKFERKFLVEYEGDLITYSEVDGTGILVKSSDGGDTWSRFGNSDFVVYNLIVLGDRLIAGTYYGIMVSVDGGATWQENNRGIFVSNPIARHNENIIIAKENELLTSPRNSFLNNTIMKSYDYGKTWERKVIDESISPPLDFSVTDTEWGTLGVSDYGLIYKTVDFGESWDLYSETSAAVFYEPNNYYERNDTLFCLFFNRMYYSINNGVSFDSTRYNYLDNIPENAWHWFIYEKEHYSMDKELNIYKSTNSGVSWEFQRKLDFEINQISDFQLIFINENSLYVYVLNDIYRGDIVGDMWEKINMPIPNTPPSTWSYHNGNIYILYTTSYQSWIYVTRDNCETWELISDDLEFKSITDIFGAGNYLFASTKEGLYRLYTGPNSVENESLLPIKFYPIPAQEVINMKYNYYNLTGVKAYDMMGREYEIEDFSNDYFNVSGLETGVYIAKLYFDDSWFLTKKFIKQ